MENTNAIGTPTGLTCPDCGGSLWEVDDAALLRYRCHTGHAFAWRSLAHAQLESSELVLRGSICALREREILLRRLAQVARTQGDIPQAEAGELQARMLCEQTERLTRLVEEQAEETAPSGAHDPPLPQPKTG